MFWKMIFFWNVRKSKSSLSYSLTKSDEISTVMIKLFIAMCFDKSSPIIGLPCDWPVYDFNLSGDFDWYPSLLIG
jgi:hypothetical protein